MQQSYAELRELSDETKIKKIGSRGGELRGMLANVTDGQTDGHRDVTIFCLRSELFEFQTDAFTQVQKWDFL